MIAKKVTARTEPARDVSECAGKKCLPSESSSELGDEEDDDFMHRPEGGCQEMFGF